MIKTVLFSTLILGITLTGLSCNSGEENSSKEGNMEQAVSDTYESHIYTQTNQKENEIIHFGKTADGVFSEIGRAKTGGMGTDGFKATTGEKIASDPLLSAGSVVLSADHKMLFVANAGDNSVSCLMIGVDGNATLADHQKTGEAGNTNSVTYDKNSRTLFVSHSFGPNQIRTFNVSPEGKLALTDDKYSVNTPSAKDRIPTQIITSPDNKFLLVDVLFNARPKGGKSGPILTPSNAGTEDGMVIFPILENGKLGKAQITNSGTPTPFSLTFLHNSNSKFINTFAAGNGAGLCELGTDGTVINHKSSAVSLTAAPNGPSETCWVSIDSKNEYAYAANFGLGNITSFKINTDGLSIVNDDIGKVKGTTGFAALAGIPTSAPSESWMSGTDFLYQLYGNAGAIVVFKADAGALKEVGRFKVPVDATQGLAGY